METNFFHPSLILIIGSLLLPLVKEPFRKIYLCVVPLVTFLNVLYLNWHPGTYGVVTFMGDWTLTFGRVDNLSMIFAFIMSLMAIIGTVYGLHVKDDVQHIAACSGARYCIRQILDRVDRLPVLSDEQRDVGSRADDGHSGLVCARGRGYVGADPGHDPLDDLRACAMSSPSSAFSGSLPRADSVLAMTCAGVKPTPRSPRPPSDTT